MRGAAAVSLYVSGHPRRIRRVKTRSAGAQWPRLYAPPYADQQRLAEADMRCDAESYVSCRGRSARRNSNDLASFGARLPKPQP